MFVGVSCQLGALGAEALKAHSCNDDASKHLCLHSVTGAIQYKYTSRISTCRDA